jgi:hypothetical protein
VTGRCHECTSSSHQKGSTRSTTTTSPVFRT